MPADSTNSPRDCDLHEIRGIEKAGKHLLSSLVPRPSRPVLIACSTQKRREKVSCMIHGTKIYSLELNETKEWGRGASMGQSNQLQTFVKCTFNNSFNK